MSSFWRICPNFYQPSVRVIVVRTIFAALLCVFSLNSVLAMPSRIIIVRHGEKADKWWGLTR